MHERSGRQASIPCNAKPQGQQKALASRAEQTLVQPYSEHRLTEGQKQVRFAQGPLNNTQDGHPRHEGQTAKPLRRLDSHWGKGITKKEVQLLEELLEDSGNVYQPSIIKLKRKCGLLPKERVARKAARQQVLAAQLDTPTSSKAYMASAKARRQRTGAAGKHATSVRQQRQRTAAAGTEHVAKQQAKALGKAARKSAREVHALAMADAGVIKAAGQRTRRAVVRFNPCEAASPSSSPPKGKSAGNITQRHAGRAQPAQKNRRVHGQQGAAAAMTDHGLWSTRLRSQAQQQKDDDEEMVEAACAVEDEDDDDMDMGSEEEQQSSQEQGEEEGGEEEEGEEGSEEEQGDMEGEGSEEPAGSEEGEEEEAEESSSGSEGSGDSSGSEGSGEGEDVSEDDAPSSPSHSSTSSSGHSESDQGEESESMSQPSKAARPATRYAAAARSLRPPAKGSSPGARNKRSRDEAGLMRLSEQEELDAEENTARLTRRQLRARAGKGASKRAKQSKAGEAEVQFVAGAGAVSKPAAPGRRGTKRRAGSGHGAPHPVAGKLRRGRAGAAGSDGHEADMDVAAVRSPAGRRRARCTADDAGCTDAAQPQQPHPALRPRRRGAAAGSAQHEPVPAHAANAPVTPAAVEGGDASAADAAAVPQFGEADAAAVLQVPPINPLATPIVVDDDVTSVGSVLPRPASPASVCGKVHKMQRHAAAAAAAAEVHQPMGPPSRRAPQEPTATAGAMVPPPTAHNLRKLTVAAARMTPQLASRDVLRQLNSGCGSVHRGNKAEQLASTGAVAAAYDGPTGSVGQPSRFAARMPPRPAAPNHAEAPSGAGAVTASGAIPVASGGEMAVSYCHSATCSQDKPPWEVLPPRASGYRRAVHA